MSTTDVSLPRLPALGRWAALPVVLAGTFMVVLDFFIVNVALPAMQADLHASAGALEWVVAGYALTSAVFLITGGRLGDRFGRRRVFSIGLALFTLSSAGCGLAGDPAVLVVARLLQGAAAALLMPNVLSIIGVAHAGEDRARAFALYGLVMGLAAVGGQLVGGVLVQLDVLGLGWRSCFLINVPVGLVALAAAPRLVPESRADGAGGAGGLDLGGTALVTVALTALVLPLVEGRAHHWPAWTWLSLAGVPVVALVFAVHQRALARRGGAPLFAPELFRQRALSAGLLTQLAFFCGQASFFLVLALYLQQGRGLDALQAGGVFTVCAAAYLAASVKVPALMTRGGRRVVGAGALALAAGHGALLVAVAAGGVQVPIVALVPGLLLVGAGMGGVIAPLTTTVLGGLDPRHAGAASGALTTMQNVGAALGVALIGLVFFGALHVGPAHAFVLSLAALAALELGVAALSRLLPGPR